jgi:hypothetical protein
MDSHDAHDENEGQYREPNFIFQKLFSRALLGTATALGYFVPQTP